MSDDAPNSQPQGFVQNFTELTVYKFAFQLQQEVFRVSKLWPREESYSLTDQIRRSSRAVGANIAEAWGKRQYDAHFVMKLTDADAENLETLHWLRTAYACQYLDLETSEQLAERSKAIGKMLNKMMSPNGGFSFPKRSKSN